jgi:flagellar protein FliO/FliZ
MENYLQELLFMLLALIFVVALAWFLLKGLKHFHATHGASGNRMRLTLSLPLGTRERMVVVTYREHEYLVGITPGGMHLIDKLPQSEVAESTDPESN